METTPQPVWRKLPRPVFRHRHEQAHECRQRFDDWLLASLGTRMDDALAYLQVELVGCGADPTVIRPISERIMVHLLAEWAKDVLYSNCECLTRADVDKFLWTKFGVQPKSGPIDAPAIVGVDRDV